MEKVKNTFDPKVLNGVYKNLEQMLAAGYTKEQVEWLRVNGKRDEGRKHSMNGYSYSGFWALYNDEERKEYREYRKQGGTGTKTKATAQRVEMLKLYAAIPADARKQARALMTEAELKSADLIDALNGNQKALDMYIATL